MLAAFPLERAEQFNARPLLLSSNAANNERVWETIVVRNGEYQAGDAFLFATDALAHWILAECEAGRPPWQTLNVLCSETDFAALVTSLRQSRAMRNDDVTLVRYVVPAATYSPFDAEPTVRLTLPPEALAAGNAPAAEPDAANAAPAPPADASAPDGARVPVAGTPHDAKSPPIRSCGSRRISGGSRYVRSVRCDRSHRITWRFRRARPAAAHSQDAATQEPAGRRSVVAKSEEEAVE